MRPSLPPIKPRHRRKILRAASYFKIDGIPGDKAITEGQIRIFGSIVLRLHKRIQIICSTQYGKSLWVALACLVLTCILKKVVVVVAPSADKAKIIMRYYINHLGDSPVFYKKLEKNTKLERLRQEENKERIMLNNGGGIFVISADQRNSKKSIEAAMGEGAEIVIGDEFCLIEDDTEATIFRMIAGKGAGASYIKIGNPFYAAPPNSHFIKTWLQPGKYYRIFIDYAQAILEGRYTEDFIAEAKTKPLFSVLFACLFPDLSEMDAQGYRLLVVPEKIKFGVSPAIILEAMKKAKEANDGELKVKPKLGCDIGGGGDYNVRTLRWHKMAAVVGKNKSSDTMTNVPEIEADMETYGVRASDVNIDDIGIGRGVSDRLKEKGHNVNAVSVGDKAVFDPTLYANLKAELCWLCKLWVEDPESRLDQRDEWTQLTWLKYKTLSDKKIQMEPKKDLKLRTKQSPDYAESLYLTFAEMPFVGFV